MTERSWGRRAPGVGEDLENRVLEPVTDSNRARPTTRIDAAQADHLRYVVLLLSHKLVQKRHGARFYCLMDMPLRHRVR
jgi:hypothetical protein